jgi:LmbE family N-acetylglucosaminyl deacetylase
MQAVELTRFQRALFVGAHSDDIEIGCGATILQWTERQPDLEICWVVFSAEGERRKEAERSASAFLKKARQPRVIIQDFRGSFFPYQGLAIKEFFETLKTFRPDIVFTHWGQDRHQDHRVLSELAWNTFRSHVILEYEIPKYDGDLGAPNVFVPVRRADCQRKASLLMKHFPSQAGKHWFAPELFLALPRIRGMECNAPTQYAEAFHGRKLVLRTPDRRQAASIGGRK